MSDATMTPVREIHITAREARDAAFRRGFFQGYFAATRDFREHPRPEILAFIHGGLTEWRDRSGAVELPPRMDIESESRGRV
ncbi:MAG: hypothetical protein RBT62_11400 [Spirochaetia bacterium]|nr:hypothetical protein [Spirochaetia bacterium]